jgi:hypothetical protein
MRSAPACVNGLPGVEVPRARQTRAALTLAYYPDESATYSASDSVARSKHQTSCHDAHGHDFHKVKTEIPSLVFLMSMMRHVLVCKQSALRCARITYIFIRSRSYIFTLLPDFRMTQRA